MSTIYKDLQTLDRGKNPKVTTPLRCKLLQLHQMPRIPDWPRNSKFLRISHG